MIFKIKGDIKHILMCIVACYICYVFAGRYTSYLNMGIGLGIGITYMVISIKISDEYDVSKKGKEMIDMTVIHSGIICIIFLAGIYCVQEGLITPVQEMKIWGIIYSIEIIVIYEYTIFSKIISKQLLDKRVIFTEIIYGIVYGGLYSVTLIFKNAILISIFIVMSIIVYYNIWKEYTDEFCDNSNYFIYFIVAKIVESIYISVCNIDNISLMFWLMFRFIQTYYLARCTVFNGIEKSIYREYGVVGFLDKKISKQNKPSHIIANLSHELKTPINVIRSAVEIISLDKNEDLILSKDIKEIKNECAVIMDMVQMIIDIQKANDSKQNTNIQRYNIVEILENISCAFNSEYGKGKIIFDTYEEEVCVSLNKFLLQDAIMGVLNIIIGMDSDCNVNVSIDRQGERKIGISIYHSQVSYIKSIVSNLNSKLFLDSPENNIIHILGVQVLLEVIKSYGGQVMFREFENSYNMVIIVEEDTNELTEIYKINEWDIMELRESIKLKYVL